ncbi:helix-turn-helix domain-containing protein [Winogradskyella forsetii]|uniref:helix-turn-helix domain-containing protein n=1 Tax=Winogradskyella forsetii TaxID=2686077 RepID=UPI0015C0440D|nr:helix-turn-helix domain-containing protein [Winogradskyella forsetii]
MEFIQEQLKTIIELLEKENLFNKEFFTLEEAARYLSQSKSSLYKLTSKKEIPHYVPNGKLIYFKRSELDEWIVNSRTIQSAEVMTSIDNYITYKL